MRNITDRICGGNQNTYFMFNDFFFESRARCEIMWTDFVQPDRPQMKIERKCIAGWIHKATNTYSGYVILVAFTLQQWFHERASLLRYTYIACLV